MDFVQWWHYLPLKQFKSEIKVITQTRQQETEQTGKDKKEMETQRNHTRITGAQDHTRSKTDTPEGFYRQLEALRGKYTLLITKRKYKAARHSKQAYNSRLTIQARHQNRTITDFSGFQKYQNSVKNGNIPIFEKSLMCVSCRNFRDSPKNNRGAFIYSRKNFLKCEV